MRIWYGKEMEGKQKGIQTLFVEDDCIDETFVSRLESGLTDRSKRVSKDLNIDLSVRSGGTPGIYIAKGTTANKMEHKVGRIYLGAGRISPQKFDGLDELMGFCEKYDIKPVIEISISDLEKVPNWFRISFELIARLDLEQKLLSNVILKIDDKASVYTVLSHEMEYTSLDDLSKAMQFKGDIAIYDSKAESKITF